MEGKSVGTKPAAKSGWVVGQVLAEQARVRGEAPFLIFADGSASPPQPVSYAEADQRANRLANGLAPLAIAHGERVGVMIPNSIDYCTVWFALSRLGAVHVSINTAYKGIFLSHVLSNAAARIVLIHADYLPWLAEIEQELPALQTAIVLGQAAAETPAAPAFERVRLVPFSQVAEGAPHPPEIEVSYRDIGSIMYTSGTTGPSKGVLMPHGHLYLFGLGEVEHLRLTPDDVYYISMPLFHANAMLMQLYGALIAGCKVVIVPSFSASRWWDDIRAHEVTVTNTLGVMTEFVYRQPARPNDGEHKLRLICAVPAPREVKDAFEQRFKTRLIEGYGMTEVNIVLYHPLDEPYRLGSCGKPYAEYFDVQVVDADSDEPLPPGQLGEIVVRPKAPYCFMQGYNDMPERTVEAWRNLWFHTGDAGKMDEDGYFYFVDRIKDCLRVRGENLSSYEIEKVLAEHPAISEAAAVAVKSDIVGGEDEIKACLVLGEGMHPPAPEVLLDYCVERMPYFAVPRYVEYVRALPKTPTQKVRKTELREAGLTAATWDREAAGYKVARGK